jgi:hypothetical protein
MSRRRTFAADILPILSGGRCAPRRLGSLRNESAAPKGDADERAELQRTNEADRCYVLDRGSIGYRL